MTPTDLALRLGTSLMIGIVLGLEREKRGRAAGLRTTTLVSLSAGLAMVLSEWLPTAGAVVGGDPTRLAAGVLTGMGFLGAGVIIRQDTLIRGVTTAAVLWTASILGLTAGSGNFGLALGGTAIVLFVLLGLPLIEHRMDNDGYVTITIAMDGPGVPMERLRAVFTSHRLTILTTSVERTATAVTVSVHATAPARDSLELPAAVTTELQALPTVSRVAWTG